MKKIAMLVVILAGVFIASQLMAQTNTKTKGSTGQSGQGSMTTAKSAKTGQMFDTGGNLLYSYDQLGYIRNAKNRVICQLTTKGEIIVKRAKVGTVDKGVFRDRFGKEYARMVQEGKIVDAGSKPVGAVKDDGTVLDKTGTRIGSAPGVDKNAVVLVFFYQDVLTAKSPNTSKK